MTQSQFKELMKWITMIESVLVRHWLKI
jgi:hypothetical protein